MPLTVRIITPDRVCPEDQGQRVILPAWDGQIGILPGHAPFVCLLGEGVLCIRRYEQGDNHLTLMAGVAQVENDLVQVFAERVVVTREIVEQELCERLGELDRAAYADDIDQAEAAVEARWIAIQLRSVGRPVPPSTHLRW